MTRKHFQLIAEALNEAYTAEVAPEGIKAVDRAIQAVAARLRSTNDAFDRERFVDVCRGERSR
jgi:hypothetical protein